MNGKNLLTIHAILVAIVSLTALLSPTTFIDLNGLETSQTAINLMRVYGAVVFGFTVASWLMRNQPPSKTRQAYFLGVSVSFLLFAVIIPINMAAIPDLETNIGWGYFALNVLLGGAFLYFGYKEPAR